MTAPLKPCDMLADDGSTTTLTTAGRNVSDLHVSGKEREGLQSSLNTAPIEPVKANATCEPVRPRTMSLVAS
jgi:hypothetical protein